MSRKVKIEAATENNILIFRITGRIWQGELASTLRMNIDNAISNGVDTVHVFMSSEGGSVFEAEDVKIEFKRLPNRKIVIGAICASAATNIIEVFGDNIECYTTSQFMIHKPSTWISGNEDQVESDLKLLKNITKNYRASYARRFNKTEDEIETLWKQDYWMTAQEAKNLGLVKTIIDENLEYSQDTIDAMVACGCPVIPKPKTNSENLNRNKMDINKLKAELGMPADATEEQIIAAVKANKTKAENAELAEANANQQKKTIAETVVNKAILEKKITADMKDTYVSLHMQDPVQTEAILASMKGAVPASSEIKETTDVDVAATTGRENWTLEDYLEKDPVALEKLTETSPELVKKLNAAYALKN